MKKYLLIALAALLMLPASAQTVEKNKLTFTRENTPELGDVYSLGDTLFADAKDFDRYPRFILYHKDDMKYRHDAMYGNNFDGQITEDFAVFPGNFREWVSQNLVYPKKAKKKRIQGVVSIAVLIDENGHAINPILVNQPDELLQKEAFRLLSIMPAWTPAHFNDRKGLMSHILDFWFELPAETKK